MGDDSNIADWLDRHGLFHLLAVLKAHGVELDVLQDLTPEDLAEIGLTLGDRKRLLKAVVSSFGTKGSLSVREGGASGRANDAQTTAAERRQITVLFSDLVGSSQLLGRLDPEESRHIIRTYRTVIAAEVERLGGHVAQYLGDGVLAYFGWPLAFEDAAVRAVAAAHGMLQQVARIETQHGEKLAIRIGIATGLVVVGGSESKDVVEDMTAVGGAVNLAARLQELAKTGQILVASSTSQLIADSIALESIGLRTFKGFADPEEVFAVAADTALPVRSRQGFIRTMRGREQELSLAFSRWQKAKNGSTQVLLITGEPGIGKSHLTERLVQSMSVDGALVRRFVCSPFQQSKALQPVLEHLQQVLGFWRGEPAESSAEKLRARLAELTIDLHSTMPFLLRLLSIDAEQWPEPDGTTPMIRKASGFAALNAILQAEAKLSPLLVILEDAHWIDPTTMEFFEQLITNARNLPVLVLINTRPDQRLHWTDGGNLTTMALQKMARPEIESIIAAVSDGMVLPAHVIDSIVDRSDGIPLFVEELTKAVLESGLNSKGSGADIPSSLRDTLLARLDRIPQARDVAQIAACIGRECDHELLVALAEKSSQQLEDALEQLAKAEILFQEKTTPHAIYRFKHALVQEAAADCLLKSKRRQIHLRIGRFIENGRSEYARVRPELLAHHFTQAEAYEEAILYRQRAGQMALAASGNNEAIGEFGQALELITLLPPSEDRDRLELEILIAQAIPYTLTKGYAAPEVEAVYKRATETSARLPLEIQSFAVIYGFWRFYLLRGDYNNAMALSQQLLELARVRKDPAMDVTSNRAAGSTRFYMARYGEALQHLGRTASIHPDEELRRSILSYDVVDPWVVNTAYSGMALWISGKPTEAIAQHEKAIALARQVNHPFTLALSLCFAQWTHQFCGDRGGVQALASEALTLSHKYGFTFWTGWADMLLAWAEAGSDSSLTRQRMKAALQLWQSTGSQLGLSYFQCLLAEQSDGADARLLLDAAERFAQEREELFWLPDVYRLKGRHALREGYDDAHSIADQAYRQALAKADKLQAHGLALRAALDLAELHQGRQGWPEALRLLKRHTGHFTSDDDFVDLTKARAVLLRAENNNTPFDGM